MELTIRNPLLAYGRADSLKNSPDPPIQSLIANNPSLVWIKPVKIGGLTCTKSKDADALYKAIKYSVVSSKHFNEEDFIKESQDSHTRRKVKRNTTTLSRNILKKDACPHIFSNLPSSHKINRRSIYSPNSSSRHQRSQVLQNKRNQDFLMKDNFNTLVEGFKKIQNEVIPEGFIIINQKNTLTFIYLNEYQHIPNVLSSLSKSSWKVNPQVTVAIRHFFLELQQFGKGYLLLYIGN
ncbi:unnamed protein product [Lepeophtheirus salmonis]|uniref:(salmon louse) hypothetical protein n=1 Tax=Lepeophtheirus salmonis TaxID=72036 RepID=A0A7R8H469_LEPSM|nr:unnamed protein product [Lepeophtheirus salmonis]CAF2852442.1 unnamed protein product [Lepeophtheirus salmonis]